jgi:deazaflavin-dependent oxidoreductase (nitroreductase family)
MPSDFGFKMMNTVHRGLLKITGGRVGWEVLDMPVLELTTVGRKRGLPHSVMLTSPVQEGATLVVVASRGGDDRSPAWLANLQENPQVDVALKGAAKQRMRARMATPQERARLWPQIVANHQNYAAYQARTSRQIPLVLLEPVV